MALKDTQNKSTALERPTVNYWGVKGLYTILLHNRIQREVYARVHNRIQREVYARVHNRIQREVYARVHNRIQSEVYARVKPGLSYSIHVKDFNPAMDH